MSSALFALGRACHAHPRRVLAAWLLLVVLLAADAGAFGKGTVEKYSVPGSESQEALDDLQVRFPQVAGATAQVVVEAQNGAVNSGENADRIHSAVTRLKNVTGVEGVSDPLSSDVHGAISADRRAAIITTQLTGSENEITQQTKDEIVAQAARLDGGGLRAWAGGAAFRGGAPTISWVEGVGLAIAAIVLLVFFRSLRAAAAPIVTALAAAGTTGAALILATSIVDLTGTAPLLALMICLAVGIDYSLFLLSRHRENLDAGIDGSESAGRATATAGSAVVFAGLTVITALLGLTIAGLPFLSWMGVAAALGVAVAVGAALTVGPALMRLVEPVMLRGRDARRARLTGAKKRAGVGRREVEGEGRSARGDASDEAASDAGARARGGASVATLLPRPAAAPTDEPSVEDPATAPAPGTDERGTGRDDATRGAPAAAAVTPDDHHDDDRADTELEVPPGPRWARVWVAAATRWPLLTVAVLIALLGLVTVPAKDLRLALPDNGTLPPESSARQAYDVIDAHFGPGQNGPLLVVADIVASDDPVGAVDRLADRLKALPGVQSVMLATPNEKADTGVVVVVPTTGPTDEATADLVHRIRDDAGTLDGGDDLHLRVTGQTASQIDVSSRLSGALVPFGIVVMGLSLLLLLIVFRSIVVPLTATLGFVLSTGAAFGVVSAVFGWGWLAGPLHVARLGPVISFMPIILMGVLFGLAMDYQMFIVSRMHEHYARHRDARKAILAGFASSAPVVAAAAIIMVAVFAAFVPEGDASLKPIALGLAVGVAIDAFVVRMTLVPAALRLFGDAAWALPKGLRAVLPHVDIEGHAVEHRLAAAPGVQAHPDRVIHARHLGVSGPRGTVFAGFDLDVEAGQLCVVTGEEGSGKTSLLLALAGRMPFENGELDVAGAVLPEQDRLAGARVGLAEFGAVNALDDDVDVRQHIAERLATNLMLPWARGRDVAGVLRSLDDAYETGLRVAADDARDRAAGLYPALADDGHRGRHEAAAAGADGPRVAGAAARADEPDHVQDADRHEAHAAGLPSPTEAHGPHDVHGPDGEGDPRLDPDQLVGDLPRLLRAVLGVALACVGDPRVVVVDDIDALRTRHDRVALWGALGWVIRNVPSHPAVVAACEDPPSPDELARWTGLTTDDVVLARLGSVSPSKVAS